MAYNGSGVFNLYQPGNPVVTGTTISSTWANNTLSDLATGLSTAITKDGQTTVTADIPMAGFSLTNTRIVGVAGAVGTPAYTFSANTTNGLYSTGANSYAASVNSTKRQEWTTTGTDITGALTVSTTLQVTGISTFANGAVGAPGIVFANGSSTGLYSTGANSFAASCGGTAVVAFGTTGLSTIPNGVVGTPSISFANSSSTGLYSTGASSFAASVSGAKVAEFKTTGMDVTGVMTATQCYGLATGSTAIAGKMENTNGTYTGIIQTIQATATAAGTGWQLIGGYDSSAQVFKVFGNGDVQNTNNSYAAISDLKYKRDIEPAKSQWADIKALAKMAIKYRLVADPSQENADPSKPLQLGLPAQEVLKVSPGLVQTTPDYKMIDGEAMPSGTDSLSVRYSVLYMKAVIALGEALERIEKLEQRA